MNTIEEFVIKFAEQFESTDRKSIKASTRYKDLEEWDSLAVLTIISMVNSTYNVELIGADVRGASTVEELYNLVMSRM
ncbi:MAG: acyl carrier protein [Bacteroidales bacterium]|nr:acyl carrier protein [Bacteroidales bacterium]